LGAEIVQALVCYGFERLRLPRLIALIDPENRASIGTAEKAGLRFERQIELEGPSCLLHAITSSVR
jgi:RimJ/RimL family protein N-acetyltransferase